MKRLDLYVLKELAVVGAFSFVVLTLVAAGGALIQLFRELPGQGLVFLLGAAPALLSYVIPHTLGISIALAGTIVLGRLNGDRELDAMRTAGIPLTRVLTAVALLGIVASVVAGLFNMVWTPAAYRARRRLEEKSVMDVLRRPPPGTRVHRFGKKYVLRYENAIGSTLKRPYIIELDYTDANEAFPKAYYVAEEAEIRFDAQNVPVLILRDCNYATTSTQKARDGTEFEQQSEGSAAEFPVELKLERTREYKEDVDGMTMSELIDEARRSGGHVHVNHVWTKFHLRIAGALAPLPLLLLAAGIGMAVRTTTLLAGFGATLPSIALYEGTWFFFGRMGANGSVAPTVAGYFGISVITILAVAVVIWRTRR